MKIVEKIVANGHGALNASYLVIHETANPGATALNHVNLWKRSPDYAVHYVGDWTENVYHTVPDARKCWQVGNGNAYVVGIELCHAKTKAQFDKVWNAGVAFAAQYLKKKGWGIDKMLSHDDCRKKWGGTDHTDPIGYFKEFGKTWDQFKAAVKAAMGAKASTTTTVNPYAEPTYAITYGSIGTGAKWVQWHLKRLGYDIGASGIDGIVGAKTYAAIKAFQKAKKIAVDGYAGPITRAKLKAA